MEMTNLLWNALNKKLNSIDNKTTANDNLRFIDKKSEFKNLSKTRDYVEYLIKAACLKCFSKLFCFVLLYHERLKLTSHLTVRVLHRCVHSVVILTWKQLNIKLIMKSEEFSSKSVKIDYGKKSSA